LASQSGAGALETLTTLRDWVLKLGAISNTVQPARYMHQAHIRRGLAPCFDVEVYSSEVGVAKPHAAIFQAALDALGVAPACAAYVGDRLRVDVGGAQAVGMKGILIEVAHRTEHDPAIVPDARIAELPELLGVLSGFV
jgi:putative hydrolase of the HAD superfamily